MTLQDVPGEQLPLRDGADSSDRGPAEASASSPRRRYPSTWDVAGLLALAFTMAVVTELAVEHVAGGELQRMPYLRHITVALGVALAVALAIAVDRSPTPFRRIPAELTNVWRDPPGAWVAFVLGVLLASPLMALWTPVVLGDADSVRILSSIAHVQRGEFGFLVEIQDNWGPHLLYGPFLAAGGTEAVRLAVILSLQALAGVVGAITFNLSKSMWGAFGSVLVLFAIEPFVARAGVLPMYPAMLAFGYAGAWFAYRALRDPGGWRYPLAATACLILSYESQAVGQLFLAVPLLLWITQPGRVGAAGQLAKVYGAVVFFSLPRLLLNLADGGLSRVRSNRTDYWIENGYVSRIQQEFWGYDGVDEPLDEYLVRLPGRFADSLGVYWWAVLLLAAVTVVFFLGRSGRLFVLACAAFMLLAVTVKQIPSFPRYYSPLWPGLAVLAGLAPVHLSRLGFGRMRAVGRGLALASLVVLVVLSAQSFVQSGERVAHRAQRIYDGPYQQLASHVDDGKGVVGARSHVLLNVDPDIPTFGGQFLTEEEYVTYLTWPSDDEVVEMLDRHDIGWVLIHSRLAFETEYHDIWLVPFHGQKSRQVERVEASPYFCLVDVVKRMKLYRLDPTGGPCPPVALPAQAEGDT